MHPHLKVTIVSSLCLLTLFAGLAAAVVEAPAVAGLDNTANAFFAPYRTELVVAVFVWITIVGSDPTLTSTVVIATGLLWTDMRARFIGPLWLTFLGAETTTWAAKYLIDRHRPHFIAAVTASSPSFPSGHATASIATYGFLGYVIARALPKRQARYWVAFLISVLILTIGFSRIFLSLHYPTDVVGGFLLGGTWLIIGWTVAEQRMGYSHKSTDIY
jgi:undecaprenyl-diphosphatase